MKEIIKQKWGYSHRLAMTALGIGATLTLVLIGNSAGLVVQKDIGTLTNEADHIIIGTVTDIQSCWEEGTIVTYITVAVTDNLKGDSTDSITIKVPGGTVGDTTSYVSDTPAFEEGENLLTFLRERGEYFEVVGWYQGKYSIDNSGRIAGTDLSVSDFVAVVRGRTSAEQGMEKDYTVYYQPGTEMDYVVFNLSEMEKVNFVEDESATTNNDLEISNAISSPGWVTILSEGFNSSWPSGLWKRYGKSPCEYTWDEDDYKPYQGTYSAWCAGYSLGGCADLDPRYSNYSNNMNAVMIYGPFDLSDATAARMTFYLWPDTEKNCDWISWYTSNDGEGFTLIARGSGYSGNWFSENVDLTGYCGDSTVWVAFQFISDESITKKGAFVDNVVIMKYIPDPTDPSITSISPNSGPAIAAHYGSTNAATDSTRVTISGSNFGSSPGSVKFWRLGSTYYDATIESWSATSIVCRVPGGVSSYNNPMNGRGNVYVLTNADRPSNHAQFHVNYSYSGTKWPGASPEVVYKVNSNTADCTGELASVQAAANTWNNTGAKFRFVYGGTTSKTSEHEDGENSIIWKDLGSPDPVAYVRPLINDTTGMIRECDLVFNDNYTWSATTSCPSDKMDIQAIATHELGHWLFLLDLYGSSDTAKTMYGGVAPGETKKRTLEPDDIAGIRYIYGNTSITVTTNAATLVEETSATLNGVLTSDGGEACQYRFEYDTNSGEPYAYNTGWTGSKTTGQSFSHALTGLTKGTKYYFRAQAKNSAGTASGSELTFLTKPDAPISFSATAAGTTQINLSWSKGSGAQKTQIQRKTGSYPSNKNNGTTVYNGTGTSTSDSGLASNTTYYYRAWSYVQGSEQWSDNYAQASATTSPGATVTTNAATLVEETSATLNGVLTSDGGQACQYRFEYDTNSGEPYAYNTGWTGSKTTGQSFSHALTGLTKGTKYYFRAQAKNSAGTASGSELTFLTKDGGTTVAIANARATSGGTTSTTVTAYDIKNLGNFGITVTFNPAVVNVTAITPGPGVGVFSWQRVAANQVQFFTLNLGIGEPIPALSGDVLLATLTLQAVGNLGDTSPLTLTIGQIVDNKSQSIAATPVNGVFEISNRTGDMNGDGQITFDDVILLAKHYYFGDTVYDDPDVNCDGRVTFDDVILLAKHYYFGDEIYC